MNKSIIFSLFGSIVLISIATHSAEAQNLLIGKYIFTPGEEIQVQFDAQSNYAENAWIGIVPSQIVHGRESENDKNNMGYQYLSKKTRGTLSFKAPNSNGAYDLRMHDTDDNGREVASVSFSVGIPNPSAIVPMPQAPAPVASAPAPVQPTPAPQAPSAAETRSQDGRYVDHGNGTVTDTKTGVMWTKKDSYADLGRCVNYNDAKNYVSQLNTGGYTDWRIPTVEELKSIYEMEKSNNISYARDSAYPLHLDAIFSDNAAYWYWYSDNSICCGLAFFSGDRITGTRKDANQACDKWAAEGVRAARR
ncbi:MAG: DUF1566 domain-containing protein [SAR324 cluster bacterium]|nr:DUF1566 domain-containing protein [SAR324 cluster bacterium]